MTRRLPIYPDDRIADALRKAVLDTSWRPGRSDVTDMAAYYLAGPQADAVALEHAAGQVVDYQARQDVEGGR